MGKFDADTSVSRVGDGQYAAEVAEGWRAVGPNGGYLAALLLSAIEAEEECSGRPGERRPIRSLVTHYLEPPQEGPCEIAVETERRGGSVTFLSARLTQRERPVTLARAVLGRETDGPAFFDAAPPETLELEETSPPPEAAQMPEIGARYEIRIGRGFPLGEWGSEAVTGGWMRPTETRPYDHKLLAAIADGWWPAAFSRLSEPIAVPTLDLTVHFRAAHPQEHIEPGEFCRVIFKSRVAHEGYIEEDGEIWSPGGVLLAQSRQLALIRSFEGRHPLDRSPS